MNQLQIFIDIVKNIILDVIPTITHLGRVRHICVNELTSIGSGNGLATVKQNIFNWNLGNKL